MCLQVVSLPRARNLCKYKDDLCKYVSAPVSVTHLASLTAIVTDVSPPQACSRKLYNWLRVAPYRPDQQVEEDDDFMDENQGKGIRVLGIAFSSAR